MKKTLTLLALIAIATIGKAQLKKGNTTTTPPVFNKIVKISPEILQRRKDLFRVAFTNPSFNQPINGLGVNYTLKPVALSDETNVSNIKTVSTNPPENKTGMTCQTSIEKVTANSTNFLSVSATGEGIYPGAVYKYDDFYKANFQNNMVNNWPRNDISITSDGAQSITVSNPNPTSLKNAVNAFTPNIRSGIGTIASSQYTYSNNFTSLMLTATAGGAYAGFSGAANFNFNKSDSSVYITYDYRVIIYNLTAEIPANGFFTDPEKEKSQNLIWISNVSYGARILANVKINASQLKIGAGAQFQYGDPTKAGFKAAADFVSLNKNMQCTMNTYTVGLPSGSILAPSMTLTLGELDQQIRTALNAVNPQSARPVMYTLYNMAGDKIGVESATDTYTNTLCIPKDAVYRIVGQPKVRIKTGAGMFDDKLDGSIGKVAILCCGKGMNTMFKAESNVKFGPDSDNEFPMTQRSNMLLDDWKNGATLEISLNPKEILGIYDEWRIVSAILEFELADQNNTPFSQGKITLQIPNIGSGIILSRNKPRLVVPIKYVGGTQNSGFSVSTPNQY